VPINVWSVNGLTTALQPSHFALTAGSNVELSPHVAAPERQRDHWRPPSRGWSRDGYYSAFMASRGFAVEGCDMAREICRHVETTRGYRMHCAPSKRFRRSRFHAIVMNHVVEHVSDPIALLVHCGSVAEPGEFSHSSSNVGSWEPRLPGWTSYQPYQSRVLHATSLRRL